MARRLSKKDEATLKQVRQRVDAARGFRQHENLDDVWKRMIDLYRGRHFPKDITATDLFVVNVAKATVDVILPSVAVNYPKLTVQATNPDEIDQATIAEAVINYWWRHYDVLPEFQAALKDFLIVGFGWLKCGYRFVEEEQVDEEGYEAAVGARMGEIQQFAADNPGLASGLPTEEDIRAEISPEVNTVILESQPFVERVSPFDVFVDPEAKSLKDARWIAQRVYKTLEAVRNNPDYEKAGRDAVEADSRAPDSWTGRGWLEDPLSSYENTADDAKRVTVWEFYDLDSGMMCVFSENGEHFLVKPTEQPYQFGHPFIMMRNYDVPDQFYPMGELEPIEALQNELNLTRTQMFADRKQFSRKWIARRDSFDERARRDLTSEDDNVVVFINGNEPLDQVITHMPTQPVNPELFQDSAVIEQDLREVSGVSEYMRGATPEVRRTATEVNTIAAAADARAQEKLSRVERYIAEIGRKLLMLAQQFVTEPQLARIMQRDGQQFHFEFEPEDIQGEFDFTVAGGSTRPMNETAKREQAMELINTLAPFGDPQIGLVNMQGVLEYVLREGFGIKDTAPFLGANSVTQGMGMAPPDPAQGIHPEDGAMGGGVAGPAAMGAADPMMGAMPPGMPGMPGELPPGELPPGEPGVEAGMAPNITPEELIALVEAGEIDPAELPPELLALLEQGALPPGQPL